MTAVLMLPDTAPHTATPAEVATPRMSVVVIAPHGELAACGPAIERARRQGAAIFTEEIGADLAGLVHAIDTVALAVDDAIHLFPETPVVLVGHATAAFAVRAFAELYPAEIAGVVITADVSAALA